MRWLTVTTALQLVVGLGLLNVWIVRASAPTAYRGGEARSLREEFAVYGLPPVAFVLVGAIKVSAAVVLIAGIWTPLPVRPAAAVVAALMIGALVMHAKVGDPARKALPATLMLVMCSAIVVLGA